MGQTTGISWTDSTWSPLRARIKPDALEIASAKGYTSLVQILEARKPNGELRSPPGKVGHHCEHASPGCEHCYSETNNGRCLPANGTGLPFDRRSRDLVEMFIDEDMLRWPLKWRKGRRIFVESQSDLFGEFVPDELIDRVFAVMALCPQHTFQVLTKRARTMREYITARFGAGHRGDKINELVRSWHPLPSGRSFPRYCEAWPLPNVWLGVSVEDQQRADERIPLLLDTPAAVRFLSVEPLLGPVDLMYPKSIYPDGPPMCCNGQDCGCMGLATEPPLIQEMSGERISWVIVGGESGPGARPMHPDWVRSIRDQCEAAGVPFFFKQWGAHWPLSTTDGFQKLPFGRYLIEDGKAVFGFINKGAKEAGAVLDGREWQQTAEAAR